MKKHEVGGHRRHEWSLSLHGPSVEMKLRSSKSPVVEKGTGTQRRYLDQFSAHTPAILNRVVEAESHRGRQLKESASA